MGVELSHLSAVGIDPRFIRSDPLFFLHIPKTGGTSITDAIAQLYGRRRVFGESGYVSVDSLARLGDRLRGSVFVAGHAGAGVVPWLGGRADIVTVLRNPADHAVSNYLHIAASPDSPLCEDANRLDFASFLRRHPEQACLQAASLAVAQSVPGAPVDPLDHEGLRTIRRFLRAIAFAGVIERADVIARRLGQLLGLGRPLDLARLNSAACRGVGAARIAALKATYTALHDDPVLAPRFAAERAVYAEAAGLDVASPAPPMEHAAAVPVNIAAHAFFTRTGAMDGDVLVCPATAQPTTIVHGPYRQLPVGRHRVEFELSADAPLRIRVQVFADGERSLATRSMRLRSGAAARPALRFEVRDPASILEFRVRSLGGPAGALTFRGVRLSADEDGGWRLARLLGLLR